MSIFLYKARDTQAARVGTKGKNGQATESQ